MKKILQVSLILAVIISWENAMAKWDFIFLKPNYSNNIASKAYLISNEQVIDFLKSTIPESTLKTYRQLNEDTVYLLLLLQNNGNQGAWGTVTCKDNSGHINVKIYVPFLPANMDGYNHYLIQMGQKRFFRDSDDVPEISVEWLRLYAK